MIPITLSSNSGILIKVNRNQTDEKTVIHYIMMNKKYNLVIQDVAVDEEGIYRLKNTRAHSDDCVTCIHNIPTSK